MTSVMDTSDQTLPGLESRRGFKWANGNHMHTGVNTILQPNAPSWCDGNTDAGTDDTRRSEMIVSAGSRHQGGVHVMMGDGAIKFIAESIDAGDSGIPTIHYEPGSISDRPGPNNQNREVPVAGSESPYGVWGAMGTRKSKEVIGEDAFGS